MKVSDTCPDFGLMKSRLRSLRCDLSNTSGPLVLRQGSFSHNLKAAAASTYAADKHTKAVCLPLTITWLVVDIAADRGKSQNALL